MKSLRLALLLPVLFASLSSSAGILLEPYLGMSLSGKLSGKFETGGGDIDYDETASGTVYGLRAGYGLPLGLGFGVEYLMGSQTVDGESNSVGDLGAFVGYNFPIMVRAYFTYFFQAKSSSSEAVLTGNAMKIGFGYTGLPFVSINVEQWIPSYTESDQDGVDSTAIDGAFTLLTVSAPFEF